MWDEKSRGVSIKNNDRVNEMLSEVTHRIESIYPRPCETSSYLIYKYVTIQFDADVKENLDYSKVVLMDTNGVKEDIYCQPGCDYKDNFLVVAKQELKPDTVYTLYIPSGTIEFVDGTKYQEDIQMTFKTAKNVLKGQIISDKDYMNYKITLTDGNRHVISNYVIGDNNFYFTDVPEGNYKLSVYGKVFDNIVVEKDKINEVTLTDTEEVNTK